MEARASRTPLAWARRRARELPHVAWRDALIARLRADIARTAEEHAASFEKPSLLRYVYADRRIDAHMKPRNYPDRGNLVARKLKAYSFAQSHGVRIPRILGLWTAPEDIAWDQLPDRVVIKSNTGSTARGVFPLRRVSGQWTMVTRSDPVTPEGIVTRLRSLADAKRVGGPYFAEELLGGGEGDALPVEVRAASFYGEVGHLLLRRVSQHGNPHAARVRRILLDGSDLAAAAPDHADLPNPSNVDAIVEVACRLSHHIPHPFVRIDLYEIDGEVVFGELTPRPGSPEYLGAIQDERLGHLWEEAQARVLNDVIDGGDYRLRFGTGPRELRIGDSDVYVPERGW